MTQQTLEHIDARNCARRAGDGESERELSKRIKKSIAKDKGDWLDMLIATRDWQEIRKLRKGFRPNQGRLRDMNGDLQSSERRAETLAEYYERVQWAVRTTDAMPSSKLGAELPIN